MPFGPTTNAALHVELNMVPGIRATAPNDVGIETEGFPRDEALDAQRRGLSADNSGDVAKHGAPPGSHGHGPLDP